MTSPDKLLAVKQAAREAGVARTTVLRAIYRGELKAEKVLVQILSDQAQQEWYGIDRDDLKRWIEERKAKGETRGRKRRETSTVD